MICVSLASNAQVFAELLHEWMKEIVRMLKKSKGQIVPKVWDRESALFGRACMVGHGTKRLVVPRRLLVCSHSPARAPTPIGDPPAPISSSSPHSLAARLDSSRLTRLATRTRASLARLAVPCACSFSLSLHGGLAVSQRQLLPRRMAQVQATVVRAPGRRCRRPRRVF